MRAIDHAIDSGKCQAPELLHKFKADEADIARFNNGVASMGIGSFSLTHQETLLWSHYANDHKGVAVRYDFPTKFLSDEDEILGVSRVSYDANAVSDWLRENIELYRDDHKNFIIGLLKKVLMSKAPSWSYEQEARIVRPKAGLFEVPRSTLTHVFFGLQTTEQDEQLVRAVVKQNYEGVKFGRAVRTSDDFGVGVIEI